MRDKLVPVPASSQFMDDVRIGLGADQKWLPAKYFYDALGTVLFDAITLLPEYGLTRADIRLLREHAPDLAERVGHVSVVAELGSGTGAKTRWILEALNTQRAVTYCPIDLSATALMKCKSELSRIESIDIVSFEESYLDGIRHAAELRRVDTSMLVLFLGSSIGNFNPPDAEQLFRSLRDVLLPGDVFYLSTDLQKPAGLMIPAYDDALGVTAAFNLNVLARINRELGGDFDLSRFSHVARYDLTAHRIEMHLKSARNQTVRIGREFTITFQEGETIWTESSYKFRPEDVAHLAEQCGYRCEAQWIDEDWPFAQSLLRAC